MRRLFRMRAGDISFIARAYWYLFVAGWMLFVRRVPTQRWLSRWQPSAASPEVSPDDLLAARRTARWTNTAARYPLPWARCLQRSIALCMTLERRGISPDLQLGVRKDEAGIDAHAWVEFQGEVLNDSAFVKTKFEKFRTPSS